MVARQQADSSLPGFWGCEENSISLEDNDKSWWALECKSSFSEVWGRKLLHTIFLMIQTCWVMPGLNRGQVSVVVSGRER